jgi:hypothetical protein
MKFEARQIDKRRTHSFEVISYFKSTLDEVNIYLYAALFRYTVFLGIECSVLIFKRIQVQHLSSFHTFKRNNEPCAHMYHRSLMLPDVYCSESAKKKKCFRVFFSWGG